MKKTIIASLMIIFATLACLGPSAVTKREADSPAGGVPPALIEAPSAPEENPAGAVYEIPTPRQLCAVVTADEALHLRSEPNEKADHIEYLTTGQQLEILAYGPWWKVQTAEGVTGYANSRYMEARLCQP